MNHLTTEEIIAFVTMRQPDEEMQRLAEKVNLHMLGCPACAEKVDAFQVVYNAIRRLGDGEGGVQSKRTVNGDIGASK